jgi:hypothetical protein
MDIPEFTPKDWREIKGAGWLAFVASQSSTPFSRLWRGRSSPPRRRRRTHDQTRTRA